MTCRCRAAGKRAVSGPICQAFSPQLIAAEQLPYPDSLPNVHGIIRTVNPQLLPVVRQLDARFTDLIYLRCQELLKQKEEDFWYHNIFIGLAMQTLKAQYHLKKAYCPPNDELCYLAWACRMLLELKVWTLYVIASEQNAKRFSQDQFVDGNTALQAVQRALAAIPPAPGTDEVQRTVAEMESQLKVKMDEAGVSYKDPFLSIKRVAKEVGLEVEYNVANVMFSKFVHATAFSVLVSVDTVDYMFVMGAQNAFFILDTLSAHLRKLGLPTFD